MFIWLGDVAYVDSATKIQFVMPAEYIKERLEMTKNASGYKELLESAKVIGVWDDHDYGVNDAGVTFAHKD